MTAVAVGRGAQREVWVCCAKLPDGVAFQPIGFSQEAVDVAFYVNNANS